MKMGSLCLSLALLLVVGVTAQDTGRVTKNGNQLEFQAIPSFCAYTAEDVLAAPVESGMFGEIATGIIGIVAPGTVESLLQELDVDALQEDPETYLGTEWRSFTFAFAAIPLLFFLGMILAFCVPCCGLIFCCCRCCDNCGGRSMQKDEDNTLCKRAVLSLLLLATTIILGIGCASVFLGGKTSINSVERSINVVNTTTSDLYCYVNSINEEFEYLIALTTDAIQLGVEEVEEAGDATRGILDKVKDLFETVKTLDQSARDVNDTLALIDNLKMTRDALNDALQAWLDQYQATLNSSDCQAAQPCKDIADQFDRSEYDVPTITIDVSQQQDTLNQVLQQDLTAKANSLLEEIEVLLDTFDAESFDIPVNVSSELNAITGPLLMEVDTLFNTISQALEDPQFQEINGQVTNSGFIGVGILAGLVGVIAVFYILGMIFGEIGRKRDDHPLERDCLANCGGCLLTLGWVFSFIFYFIIAFLAAFYFLFGSVGEIFICQPLAQTSSFDQIKDLAITLSGDVEGYEQLKDLEISDAIDRCQNNEGLWPSLKLDDFFGEEFDKAIADVREGVDVVSMIDKINITESLRFEGQDDLRELATLNFTSVNFTSLMLEVDKPVPVLADELTEITTLADNVRGADATLADQLDGHANRLQEIIDNELAAFQQDLNALEAELPNLETKANELAVQAGELTTSLDELLKTDAPMLEEEVNEVLPTISKYINQTLDHVVAEIKTNVGRCRPLYNLLDGVEYVVCDNILNSLNAIWLGLGTAVIFFIFGIILAVKLSKYYKRMTYDDIEGSGGQGGYPSYDKANYPV